MNFNPYDKYIKIILYKEISDIFCLDKERPAEECARILKILKEKLAALNKDKE